MNPRNTAILFLVAVLLGGIVWYSNRQQTEKVEAEAQAKQLFGDLKAESIEWIELRTTDGKDVRLERTGGVWQMTKPVAFPADATNADAIASALVGLNSEGVIEDAQSPEVYGLGDGATVLRFRAAGVDHELRAGKKTPVGANNYVATGAGGSVYTVATFKVTSLEKPVDDLRERRPIRFDREGIERIEATWVDGGVVLEKKDGKWRLVAPFDAEADSEVAEGLLADLIFLRATGFVDEPPSDAEAGLDRPQYRVVLLDAAEEGKEPLRHELVIGGVLESGSRVARGVEKNLYKIPNESFDALPKSAVAFRWKTLSNFVATDARRFEVSFSDASAQGSSQVVTVTGEHDDAGWTTQPEPMGPGLAARLVAELARLKAEDIAAEKMGDAELAAVGLAPPRATVRVLGAAPEGGGDAPEFAKLFFGVEKNHQIFAQVPGRETVYRVAGSLAQHVPLSFEAFQNRFVAKEPPPQPDAPDASLPLVPGDDGSMLPGPADAGEAQVDAP